MEHEGDALWAVSAGLASVVRALDTPTHLAERLECIQLTLQAIERLLERGVELMRLREAREDEMFEWRLEARRRSIE